MKLLQRQIILGVAAFALAALAGPAPARSTLESPEPSTFANVHKFRATRVEVYTFFQRNVPSILHAGSMCIGGVRERTDGDVRWVHYETGCHDSAPFHGDWQAGTGTVTVRIPTSLSIYRQERVGGGWRTMREKHLGPTPGARIRLSWQGGEPQHKVGTTSLCAPMVVFYGCVPAPAPRVSRTYDAIVHGEIRFGGLRVRVPVDGLPGTLSFSLPL